MQNNLQLFQFQGQDVRVVWDNNEPWPIFADTCKCLGISNPSDMLKRVDPKRVIRIEVPDAMGRMQLTTCISMEELKKFVAKSNKLKAIDFAQALGLETSTLFCTTKEQHTLSIISAAFSHIEQETQRYVNGYRIDLYFPEYRIAVECDENGHNRHEKRKEIERQHFIEDALGCAFIRYNPDDKNFNIGTVINRIMRAIHEK